MPGADASPGFSPTIRRLHLLVALLVTLQILLGLVMNRDTPRLFLGHQYLGLAIVTLVLIHWLWLVTRERTQLAHLFPLESKYRQAVLRDLAGLRHGREPETGPRPGLPALIHGLGLLALTLVAALGAAIFVLIQRGTVRSPAGEAITDLHIFFAWVLIIYWVGHVLLAGIHELRGERVIARMFSPRR